MDLCGDNYLTTCHTLVGCENKAMETKAMETMATETKDLVPLVGSIVCLEGVIGLLDQIKPNLFQILVVGKF